MLIELYFVPLRPRHLFVPIETKKDSALSGEVLHINPFRDKILIEKIVRNNKSPFRDDMFIERINE
jgi:hypothetical protein